MNPNEYQKLAIRTECDQYKSTVRLNGLEPGTTTNPEDFPYTENKMAIRLNHALHGMAAEAGEAAGWFLKAIYYGKGLTEEIKAKIAEEVGDELWFCAQALTALGLNMEDVMRQNILKLKARFPHKFTDELSENRNEEAEREAMMNPDPVVTMGSIQSWIDELPEEKRAAIKEAADRVQKANLSICKAATHHYNEHLGRCVRCGYTLEEIKKSGGKPTPEFTGEWGLNPRHGQTLADISQQIQQQQEDDQISKDDADKQ